MNTQLTRCIGLLSICWFVACHDTRRNNPLDPALTPAVELFVAVDDTSGTAMLTWTPYAGEAPFAAYLILRQQPHLVSIDTLANIGYVALRTFVDSTLDVDTEYLYRVVTVNAGGFEATSTEQRTRPLSLPPVHILDLNFASATASASLA